MNRIFNFFLKTPAAAFVLCIAISVAGFYAFTQLTIEAFPDPTDTQVQVITIFPGQPTEEVERRVSLPIERALNGTPKLIRLRSISIFGLSFVTLTFDDGVDAYFARQQVKERLADVELPEGVTPDLGPLATPIGEIYRYTLESKDTDPMTLRTLQDWTVRPKLLQVQGVADVVSYGGLLQEIQVQPLPPRMATLGVSLDAIFDALKDGSANASGGYMERGAEMFVIRSLGTFRDLNDIRNVRVGYRRGVPITVKDVANVNVGYSPRQGFVTRDDSSESVEGIVLMRRGENPSVVLTALREMIGKVNTQVLPGSVKITPFYDRTELVDTTLHTVFHNLAEGAFLVVAVLFVFLLSVEASLIVALVIPISLAASFAYLYARGMSSNLLSMGAVDFGIIVDGAVILIEHLFHHFQQPPKPGEMADFPDKIRDAATEVARPTLFSLLIIIAAYLPIFSLQRVEGRIFAPMANTVVSALVGALVASFTLVPVLAMFALRRNRKHRESPILEWFRRRYRPTLDFALKNTAAVMVLAFGVLAAAVIMIGRLGSEFLPELNEGALYVTFSLPENISQTQARMLTPKIKNLLRETPEVVGVLSQLGRPEDGTDATLPNNLEVFLKLKPLDQWRSGKKLEDLIKEMAGRLKEIPGIEYNFSQPIRDNVNENISGQFGQIAVKIYGDDLNKLQDVAEQAKGMIAGVAGVADLGIVKSGESPQVVLNINRAALARYDLDLGRVQQYIEMAMAGHVASEYWDGEKKFDISVRLPISSREDVSTVKNLRLPLKSGMTIPLSAVADVTISTGRMAITRENGQRYVGLRMNVRGRDMGSFVGEARQKLDEKLKLPEGYQLTWSGEFENQQRAMHRLQLVIPVALGLTFLLLFSAFKTVKDPLIIFFNIPFALVGGVFALGAAGLSLSVSAAVGFIALLGQAVLNGVLVVASCKTRIEAGEDIDSAVLYGSMDRLRAVLMTAFLAALGLIPAALSHAIGSETQRPIAVVVVGGTVSAAFLTLVVMPVTIKWAYRRKEDARALKAVRELA